MGLFELLSEDIPKVYTKIIEGLPLGIGGAVNVFVIALTIAVVAFLIWYFYRTLSQKNLISLNLNQYNRSDHPTMSKVLAIALYFVEYVLIMPILILVWFTALSIFILIISSGESVSQTLLLTAAMVGSIRILAYWNGEIAKDLAKLFPFITLSVFLLTPNAFDVSTTLGKFSGVPELFTNIFFFLLAIFVIEIFLRVVYTITQLIKSGGLFGEGVAISKK